MVKYLGLKNKEIEGIEKFLKENSVLEYSISDSIEVIYNYISKTNGFKNVVISFGIGLKGYDLIIQKIKK